MDAKQTEPKQVLLVSASMDVGKRFESAIGESNSRWALHSAATHKEALGYLATGRALDAVLVDLTNLDLKGTDLLKEAVIRQPGALRIGLAAPLPEGKTSPLAYAPTHQIVPSESPPRAWVATLARAFAAQNILSHDHFKKLLSGLQTLPVLPQIYTEVMDELESEDPSLERAGEIVSRDMGLSARLLQMVNSAYFGLKRAANSPGEAVMFLGTEMTKALVLSLKVFAQFDHLKSPELNLEQLWRQSWSTAVVARGLCREEGAEPAVINDAFMAGLLHKAGILVFAANFPEYFKATLQYSIRKKTTFWEAEYQFYNASHAELGAYLFSLWGMPDGMIEAIAYHNRPMLAKPRSFCALTALHVANALASDDTDERALRNQPIDREYLRCTGALDRLENWQKLVPTLLTPGKK